MHHEKLKTTRVSELFEIFQKERGEFLKYLDQNSAIKASHAFNAYKCERDGVNNCKAKWS